MPMAAGAGRSGPGHGPVFLDATDAGPSERDGRPRSQYLEVPGMGSAEDPEYRLRIVRTATESIHEVDLEDERRRVGKRRRKHTFKKWTPSHLARGLTLKRDTVSSTHSGSTSQAPPTPGVADAIKQVEHGLGVFADQMASQHQQQNTRTAGQEEDAKAERFRAPAEEGLQTGKESDEKNAESRRRRNVYVNVQLPMSELDKYGQPRIYARNKVRTTKYTLYSFVPKNLSEQFRRVANLYFLGTVVLQVFPIFGGASPVLAMLPLLAIIAITAVKDGIEDYRRAQLDDGVNNSAVTRLGEWRNVNLPTHARGFFARLFGLKGSASASPVRSAKVSRGVRKLRETEGEYNTDFLYEGGSHQSTADLMHSNGSTANFGQHINSLARDRTSTDPSGTETLVDRESDDRFSISTYGDGVGALPSQMSRARSASVSRSMATSARTEGRRPGVVDYDRPAPGTAKWERTLWKKLEVGDVLLLKENDQVPADIVVLSTSDADGQCFVETKNLDGETNLKPRRALKATLSIQHEEDIEHAQFVVDSEPPHANLYSYNGVLRYYEKGDVPGREHPITEGQALGESKEKQEAITINELLLRGCALRNTSWVIGLVVYTGEDTKIMLNQGATPSKRSKIEKETNYNVIVNFLVLVGICLACAIANGVYLNSTNNSGEYFERGSSPSSSNILNAVVTFGACLIVFQNIVPISLVITVELVKTIQAIFIFQDIDMWYEALDLPCVPKTWNISDDLGQIEYIFSDKTGTLTQNVMEFKKCSVNGIAYGEGVTEAMMGAAKREGKDTSAFDPAQNEAQLAQAKSEMVIRMNQMFKNKYLREDKLTFIAPKAVEDLGKRNDSQRQNLINMFRALAICHTVVTEHIDPDNQNIIEYKAESPDESALVAAARDFGFVFLSRSNAEIEIEVMGQRERYQPLRVLEFNSSRKRMSVIVRQPDGRILMICKGADSVIYQRLREDHDPALKASTSKDMEDFANGGLRTLCIAYKYLTDEEFISWANVYDAACAAVTDREDEIEKACEFVEHNLTILGATALEDKLQVGVPDAIAQLHKAGIKLWILTGDKVQTAIEIGFSCNLLTNDMEVMIISAESETGARTQIEAGLDKMTKARMNPGSGPVEGFAVVIDGETLRYALDPALKPLFLEFTTQCSAVVCCRVSPSQKALTVKLVKDGKNAMTLAIGDGANDVAMIQEAHIGVGIAGLEGAQASMSADYAIGQFRFLTKLLLVHGRWCYIRVAEMHANFFYKNIVWVFAMFWYQLFCNFDGGYLFDYSLVLLYNLAFTSLPVIVMGAFDQDINAKVSMTFPQLYKRGIAGLEYSRAVFWAYMFDGLYQSAVVFFIPFLVYNSALSSSGNGYDMSAQVELGTTVATAAVICVTLFVGLNTSLWTWMMAAVLLASVLVLFVWIAIYSAFPFTFKNLVVTLFGSFDYWALIVIVQVVAIGPRYLYKYVHGTYYPTDNDIIREAASCAAIRNKVDDYERDGKEKQHKPDTVNQLHHTPSHERKDDPLSLGVPVSNIPFSSSRNTLAPAKRTPSPIPPTTLDFPLELAPLSSHRIAHSSVTSDAQYAAQHDAVEELGDQQPRSPLSPTSLHSDNHLAPSQYASFGGHSSSPSHQSSGHSPSGSHAAPFFSPMQSPVPSPRNGTFNGSPHPGTSMRRQDSMMSFATADENASEYGDHSGYAR